MRGRPRLCGRTKTGSRLSVSEVDAIICEEAGMKRRTFLMKSVLGVGGLAGVATAGLAKAEAITGDDGNTGPSTGLKDTVGRAVRITSISFTNGLPLEEIVTYLDQAGP